MMVKKVVTLTLNVVKSGLINNLEKFRGVILWLNRLLMTTFFTITHMISGLCIDAIPNLTACDTSIGIIFVPPCNQKVKNFLDIKLILADIKNLAKINRKFTTSEFSCSLLKNYMNNSLSNIR